MIPRDLHFRWADGAYLLLFVFLFATLIVYLFYYRENLLKSFKKSPALNQLLIPRSRIYFVLNSLALVSAWILATFALMQPEGQGHYNLKEKDNPQKANKLLELNKGERIPVTRRRKAHEVIFVMDTSASMTVADTRTKINRFEFGKEIADEIVRLLDGQGVVLYAFTSQVTPVVPLTLDYLFTRMSIRRLTINEGGIAGTDLLETLEELRSRYLMKDNALKTVVILSDGGDTRVENAQGEKREKEIQAIVSRVEDAESRRFRVFTIGLGSKEGGFIPNILFEGQPVKSILQEDILKKLSEKGRGHYYFANEYSALSIAEDIVKSMKQDPQFEMEDSIDERVGKVEQEKKDDQAASFDLYFQVPLGLSILLLGFAMLLPEVRKKGFNGNAVVKTGVVIFFIFSYFPLWGEEKPSLDSRWKEAENNFFAHNWQKAAEIYESMLKEDLPPYQRVIVQGNRALVATGAGNWEEAIALFKKLDLGKKPSPYMIVRLKSAEAYSLTQYANVLLQSTDDSKETYKENLQKVLKLLEASLTPIKEAEEAEKQIADLENREPALASFNQIRREVKDLQLLTLQLLDTYQTSHMSVQERVTLLLDNLKLTQENLKILAINLDDSELLNQYLQEYFREQRPHRLHWDTLHTHFEKEENQKGIKAKLFFQAEQLYLRGMDYLKEERLWEARLSFAQSGHVIALLSYLELEQDPFEGLLYDRVLLLEKMINDSTASESLKKSLRDEYESLIQMANEVSKTIPIPKEIPENSEVSSIDIQKGIEFLLEEIQKQVKPSAQDMEEGLFDTLFYKNLFVSEGDILQALLTEGKNLQSQLKVDDKLRDQILTFLRRLQIVGKKLEFKKQGSNPSWQKKAMVVHPLIEDVIAFFSTTASPNDKLAFLQDRLMKAIEEWDVRRLWLVELDNVIATYSSWFNVKHANPATLEKILDQLKTLQASFYRKKQDIVTEQNKEKVQTDIDQSITHTTESLKLFAQLKKELAKLFAEEALYRLQHAKMQLIGDIKEDPASLLTKIIALETLSISFNDRYQSLVSSEGASDKMVHLLKLLQKESVDEASTFVDQTKKFMEASGQQWEKIIDEMPLKEVLPLYHLGFNAATQAKEKLSLSPPPLAEVLTIQKEALKYWEEALQKFSSPEKEKNEAGNEQDKNQSNDQSKDNDQNQDNSSDEREALDLLQQMESEDSQLNPAKPLKVKEGLRPW